jgi:hypothetical protein
MVGAGQRARLVLVRNNEEEIFCLHLSLRSIEQ